MVGWWVGGEEAEEEALKMLGVYVDFCFNEAAIPVIEKFAGALFVGGMVGWWDGGQIAHKLGSVGL